MEDGQNAEAATGPPAEITEETPEEVDAERQGESAEGASLLARCHETHRRALESEKAKLEKSVPDLQQYVEVRRQLSAELNLLTEAVAAELVRLNEDHEQFQETPESLRNKLANYKKGIAIIQRMFDRARGQEADVQQDLQELTTGDLEPETSPDEVDKFGQFVVELSKSFHKFRDANYNAIQDSKELSEKCRKAAMDLVGQILPPIDAIDRGIKDEAETRAMLAGAAEGEQESEELRIQYVPASIRTK